MPRLFDDEDAGNPCARLAFIWGAWTLVGLFFASQNYVMFKGAANPGSLGRALVWQMSAAYVMALFTPLILWLARRYRIARSLWRRHLLIHLLAGSIISVVWGYCHLLLDVLFSGLLDKFDFGMMHVLVFTRLFDREMYVYAIIVLLSHSVNYYQSYREGVLWATQAQLHALKLQLHPHFLFNTLNTIAVTMHEDVEAADAMVMNLAGLLRSSLNDASKQEVRLRQELEVLDCYLQIEHVRFHGRLRVVMDIEHETLDAFVPSLLLQPLVENAIRHGIAPYGLDGEITVSAKRDFDVLRITVRDDGPGAPQGQEPAGVGLTNTRARLRYLYGHRHLFETRSTPGAGFYVRLTIPFRTALEG